MIAMRFEGGPLDGAVRTSDVLGARFDYLVRNEDGSIDRVEYEWVEADPEKNTAVGRYSRTVQHEAPGYRERAFASLVRWILGRG